MRIAPNHLSFNSHAAQKAIYGFGSRTVPSMVKDPVFFTPEVDHSMNIINEVDKEEHARMRRMLSFAFSNSNLLENEDVLVRRTDEFVAKIAQIQSADWWQGIDIVREFNYVTFNIMGSYAWRRRGNVADKSKQGRCRLVIRSKTDWKNKRVCNFRSLVTPLIRPQSTGSTGLMLSWTQLT